MNPELETAETGLSEDETFSAALAKLSGEAPEAPEAAELPADSKGAPAEPDESGEIDWSALPPAAKAQYDQLQTELRQTRLNYQSLNNRVPGLQRELDKLRKSGSQSPRRAEQSPRGNAETTTAEFLNSPEWRKHRELYPEEALPVEAAIKAQDAIYSQRLRAQEQQIAGLKHLFESNTDRLSYLDELRAHQSEQEYQMKAEALTSAHSDWASHFHLAEDKSGEYVIDKLSDSMREWLDTQPAVVLKMLCSADVDDCTFAMNAFKAWDNSRAGGGSAEATAIKAERERKLKQRAAVPTSTGGIARAGQGVLSEDEEFSAALRKIQSK